MKLPIISLAILGGQGLLAFSGRPLLDGLNQFQSFYTGYDIFGRTFAPQNLAIGYVPWLAKRFILPIARPGASLARMHLPVSLS